MIPGWLLHGDLAPAGNRVFVSRSANTPRAFPGYVSVWLQSGTAALAQAFRIARQRRADLPSPSVLLPAYGCPDLVAAALFADVRPILVDINPDDPAYDLAQLARAIDHTTVAILAVNFLGIRERLADIRALLVDRPDILLIEDNAQWFPERRDQSALEGDLICLSFGRGKPVSLLGGGALLVSERLMPEPHAIAEPELAQQSSKLAIKAALINALLQPYLYWLVNRNPGIELGRTVFKPLASIRSLDEERLSALENATERYLSLSRGLEEEWAQVVSTTGLLKEVAAPRDRRGRLLRYPVLCRDASERDFLWRALDTAGLGVTAMYRAALPDIEGMRDKVSVFDDYAGARAFASRLLTLPTHEYVRPSAVARVSKILSALASKAK